MWSETDFFLSPFLSIFSFCHSVACISVPVRAYLPPCKTVYPRWSLSVSWPIYFVGITVLYTLMTDRNFTLMTHCLSVLVYICIPWWQTVYLSWCIYAYLDDKLSICPGVYMHILMTNCLSVLVSLCIILMTDQLYAVFCPGLSACAHFDVKIFFYSVVSFILVNSAHDNM